MIFINYMQINGNEVKIKKFKFDIDLEIKKLGSILTLK